MSGSSMLPPIVRLTVSASDSTDDKRLQTALVEIAAQDPTLRVDAQQMGIAHSLEGTSASHLESICNRLRDEYHLAINVSPPEAVLVETIRKSGEAEGKFIRQVGGLGNYGHCKLHIEPRKSGEGYVFASAVSHDALPEEYLSSIERGVQSAMRLGVLSGHHLVDLKVTVVDGSYHAEDSNPVAFEIAGTIALRDAVRNAAPILLEPMMLVEIEEVPQELAATIRDEVNTHRGRVDGELTVNGWSEFRAIVPLSELLLSNSRLLAEFPTEFAGYEPVSDGEVSGDNGTGVTANKPSGPPLGRRSEMARLDQEDE
jgi:elongation factor G